MKRQFILISLIFFCFLEANINSQSVQEPSDKFKFVTTAKSISTILKSVSKEDLVDIEKAQIKVFTNAHPGGNKEISYTSNGKYMAKKVKDQQREEGMEYQTMLTTIYNEDGQQLWHGRTGRHILISNNGKNFIATDFTYSELGIEFYDINSSHPINTLNNYSIYNWVFTNDSKKIIMWGSSKIVCCSADGQILWESELFGAFSAKVAVTADGKKIAVTKRIKTDRTIKRQFSDNQTPQQIDKENTIVEFKQLKKRNRKKAEEIITYYSQKGHYGLVDTLKKILEEPDDKDLKKVREMQARLKLTNVTNWKYITILDENGNYNTYSFDMPGGIHEINFSFDGRFLAVLCGRSILYYETDYNTPKWIYTYEKYGNDSEVRKTTISPDNNYIAIIYWLSAMKSPSGKSSKIMVLLDSAGNELSEYYLNCSDYIFPSFSEHSNYLLLYRKREMKTDLLQIQ